MSPDFPWGPIIIFWVTFMTFVLAYTLQPEDVTYIQFDPDSPPTKIQPESTNTQPPWEA